jgi:hypothetical protein
MNTTTTHDPHECDTCERLDRNARRLIATSFRRLKLVADRCGAHEVEVAA